MPAEKPHPPEVPAQEVQIAIIGAGFSGLGMGYRLLQAGIQDFVILERAHDVGGVWRDNTYPGCACDVQSYLYSFSFAPKPDWDYAYAGQAEILEYLRDCARRFGLRPFIRLGHALESARWDPARQRWLIESSQGSFVSGLLISGTGAFSEAKTPDLKGLKSFEGKVFHSASWDHQYSLKGKRVGVIGTGASAIQFVPEIQPLVSRLTLFQRTPAWVLPRLDHPNSELQKNLFKSWPWLLEAKRLQLYLQREFFGISFRHPQLAQLISRLALRHLNKAIRDPQLRARLRPDYVLGCKRALLSNTYYPALAQPNVEVITSGIEEVRPQSILSQDGQEYPLDTLIFGTGFQVTDYLIARRIYGSSGQSLAESWQGSPQAYLGTMMADFPNLFFLLGPNTGLGHNSVVLMIEAQIELTLAAIQHLQRHQLSQIEPLPHTQARFIEALDRAAASTVWASGCQSWYLDSKGRNSTIWPGSVGAFKRRLLPFAPADYHFRA